LGNILSIVESVNVISCLLKTVPTKTASACFTSSSTVLCPMQEQAKIFPEKLVKSKSINMVTVVLIALGITFGSYPKVAIFTTNVDAENQTLINHKCVCGALNRHFCQIRVMVRFSHFVLVNSGVLNLFLSVSQPFIKNDFSILPTPT